ncbi:MAG: hypothetical protein QM767_22625 [Anaeromyxobacter sp.]
MQRLETTAYGFRLALSGAVTLDELSELKQALQRALERLSPGFGALVDLRRLAPLSAEASERMIELQRLCRAAGLVRSAVVLDSALVATQFSRLAALARIRQGERHLDAGRHPDWERAAERWVVAAEEPVAPVPLPAPRSR